MPPAVHALALAVFAQATSEFMLSGLVHPLAADLGVPLAAAGALTSGFALGMVLGAPLAAALSLRWPPRRALLGFLTAFLLAHVLGALTPGFAVLLTTRVVAALATAGFLAVALGTAARLAGPGAQGRATATLLAGTTTACVVGVPAGALLGELWGWRSAFWAVALLTAPALVAVLRSVPAGGGDPGGAVAAELRGLRVPGLRSPLLLAALVNGGTFCAFTYLAPLVTDVAGRAAGWVPVALAVFGCGAFAGVVVAGRAADRRPARLLAAGLVALPAGWLLLAAFPVAPLLFAQAALSFAVGSTLVAEVLRVAPGAPRLAGAAATAALNAGAVVGPLLGGAALAGGARAALLVSAALTACALVFGSRRLTRARA
ncbi:Cmx/CmrA family chloramphenicol efflux MFS transporter [Actinosynnema pretiosum]|uniref:Chloramphenicol efflux pump n=1 Tax=Actinosynnema pretiosum TaxID=42197 RepID=A0A290Z6B4_9PSEU|nr:Cmx/CmrA family chloramphenicol efflux MFS transporter [Actinosynnema pretiosum]ATE54538.1 chloramphenicol efflux pump [Actinosynnema pretiosum]